jgi:DNA-binding response OmpR family regulator
MRAVACGNQKRILSVEDDPSIADVLAAILEGEGGYVVERVACGRAALASLMERRPDLLLLDLGLPDLDGLEVCRLARRHVPDLPIIALTARTGTRDVVAGLDGGADDYIRKPVDLDVLLARIAALLGAGHRRGAGGS